MRTVLVIMTGVGFFLGVVFGLLLQLPIDNTLPADAIPGHEHPVFNTSSFRSRRSLSEMEDNLQQQQQQDKHISTTTSTSLLIEESPVPNPASNHNYVLSEEQNIEVLSDNVILQGNKNLKATKEQTYIIIEALRSPPKVNERKPHHKQISDTNPSHYKSSIYKARTSELTLQNISALSSQSLNPRQELNLDNEPKTSKIVSISYNLQRNTSKTNINAAKHINDKPNQDASYLTSIVNGILWTPQLDESCPKPFKVHQAEAWRRRVDDLDVVKITEGCGRMQNRLLTFRDASKACARYRLNTDQIQGEIFSYYLARVFNMTNIPPTSLARVETLSSKWRTVHLQLSLAQWAESKLVVLTQHIGGLQPAHIPEEFKEEGKRLEPTLSNLGFKSHTQLCELVQWSDLIVFDYLTANLDRVINNMFNSQWNDQMMSSPAHNLEQRPDGSLVFLDNESGLFHGYRLLDKYSTFHQTLLRSLCVFRPSTAETIKRLHESSSIGKELHSLFASSEVLHEHLAAIPEKNVKVLQQRIDEVYKQMLYCQSVFNR